MQRTQPKSLTESNFRSCFRSEAGQIRLPRIRSRCKFREKPTSPQQQASDVRSRDQGTGAGGPVSTGSLQLSERWSFPIRSDPHPARFRRNHRARIRRRRSEVGLRKCRGCACSKQETGLRIRLHLGGNQVRWA